MTPTTPPHLEPHRVGIRELAKQLDLSVGTVSNAFNHPDRVKPATRHRILEFARSVQFIPDRSAQSLRQQRTGQIGLVLPDAFNPFYSQIGAALQQAVHARGFEPVMINSANFDLNSEINACRHLASLRVEGAVFVIRASASEDRHLRNLVARRIPIVMIGGREQAVEGMSSVGVDGFDGMRDATRHLIKLGHRRFAVVGPPPLANVGGPPRSFDRKLAGIHRAVADAGLDTDAVELLNPTNADLVNTRRVLTERIAGGRPLPTAMIATADHLAIGVIGTLAEHGLRVPDDVSVVGYDNIEYAAYIQPALTTVSQTHCDTPRHAIDMLCHAIANPNEAAQHRTFKSKLIIRRSTAPAPDRHAGRS